MVYFIINILYKLGVFLVDLNGNLIPCFLLLLLFQVDNKTVFELFYVTDLRIIDKPLERFLSSIQ